jgi:hypothetical protein
LFADVPLAGFFEILGSYPNAMTLATLPLANLYRKQRQDNPSMK